MTWQKILAVIALLLVVASLFVETEIPLLAVAVLLICVILVA